MGRRGGCHTVHYVSDRGLVNFTVAAKLAGIALMDKLWWGYAPSAGELGKCMLKGRARQAGKGQRARMPVSKALLGRMIEELPRICISLQEADLFAALM